MERVTHFFKRYAKAFESFDLQAAIDCFHLPCLFVSTEKTVAYVVVEELKESVEAVLQMHSQEGYAKIDFALSQVHTISAGCCFVTVDWQLSNAEGDLLSQFWHTYQLVDEGNGWEITLSAAHGLLKVA